MDFGEAVKSYFAKWDNFQDKSGRTEYLWAILFVTIFSFSLPFLLWLFAYSLFKNFESDVFGVLFIFLSIGLLFVAYTFLLIALTALSVRRLRDVGKSGWWCLIALTIFGLVPLAIWCCGRSISIE